MDGNYITGCHHYGILPVGCCILCVFCSFPRRPHLGVCFGCHVFSCDTNRRDRKHGLSAKDLPRQMDELSMGAHSSPSSASISSIPAHRSCRKGSTGGSGGTGTQMEVSNRQTSCSVGGIFCTLFVYEDCRKEDGTAEQDGTSEDALFCTLCKCEVRKFSKHCRSCDKCVDGFDRHCRWLNNRVGLKNYVSFISLMATSVLWVCSEAN